MISKAAWGKLYILCLRLDIGDLRRFRSRALRLDDDIGSRLELSKHLASQTRSKQCHPAVPYNWSTEGSLIGVWKLLAPVWSDTIDLILSLPRHFVCLLSIPSGSQISSAP